MSDVNEVLVGAADVFAPATAEALERCDPVASRRQQFLIPRCTGREGGEAEARRENEEVTYLVGNSLGCQPLETASAVRRELDNWARLGVEAHWHAGSPWLQYQEPLRGASARLAGCSTSETVLMNGLTVNLHLLMMSFYRPSAERYRIVVEGNAFPSDLHAVATQVMHHGRDPDEGLVRLVPRPEEHNLRTEDVIELIEREGPTVALVLLGGVNYMTGELLDMPAITEAAHEVGCMVGWDLAHAIGNVPLSLHDWDVDFAAWCTYKYLNGGPGAVAGCFVHERHGRNPDLPRLGGWWGNDIEARFQMRPEFVPAAGAAGWQISNPSILALAPLLESFRIFDEVGIDRLRARSQRMTGYLEELVNAIGQRRGITVTTPSDPARRGCQLSLDLPGNAQALSEALMSRGVVCDVREPSTLRVAPVPLYNTYADIRRFAVELDRCLESL